MNDVTEAIAKQLSVLDGNEPDSFTVEANVIDGDSSGPVTIRTHDPQWRDEHATWRTYIGRAEKLRQHLRDQGYVIERGYDNNGWRVEAVFEQDATHDHKKKGRAHVFEEHENCTKDICPVCDGGLAACTVCGQAEGDLEPKCPGPDKPDLGAVEEDITQFLNAVERARLMLEEAAKRLTTPDDRYGGLMYSEDADTFEKGAEHTRFLLDYYLENER